MKALRLDIKRDIKGFTLMELLVVIAIMVILFAIAAPVGGSLFKNMRMMQLDNTAKSIYVAAQQRVSSLQSAYEMEILATPAAMKQGNVASQIAGLHDAVKPSDYSGTWNDDKHIFYLDSATTADDKVIQTYLVTGNDTASGSGNYIIEVSPYSGEVYSVIYWENDDYNGLSYDDIVVKMGIGRMPASRSDAEIGYYGGKPVQDSHIPNTDVTFDDLNFQLVNWEDLYVKLTSSDLTTALANSSTLEFDVTVTGDSGWGTSTVTLKYSGDATSANYVDFSKYAGTDADGKPEIDFVLDSMYGTGNDFATVVGNQINAGSNITVSVAVSYKGTTYTSDGVNSTVARPGLASQGDNSLFDSLNSTTGVVKVSCLRHLNNLRSSALGTKGWVWGKNAYGNIVQTYNARSFTYRDASGNVTTAEYEPTGVDRNIDFSAVKWQPTSVALEHLSSAARATSAAATAGTPNQPVTYFTPIALSNEQQNALSSGAYNGQDAGTQYALENFVIGDTANRVENTGLFETATFALDNIYSYDSKVFGAMNTGTFVGNLPRNGGSLTNCHVVSTTGQYGDKTCSVTGGDYTGGLVGQSYKDATNSSSDADVTGGAYTGGLVGEQVYSAITFCMVGGDPARTTDIGFATVTGGDYTGGLVGHSSGSVATSSAYANVSGGTCTGGLVGQQDYNTIASCSSGGDPARTVDIGFISISGGDCIGGLVGLSSATIDASTAYANVTGSNAVGGFIGQQTNGNVTNCTSGGDPDSSVNIGFCTVTGDNWGIGGFVGDIEEGSITGSTAMVNVTSGSVIGGFVGSMESGTVTSCGARGYTDLLTAAGKAAEGVPTSVTTKGTYVGGFLGNMTGGSITYSYAAVNVAPIGTANISACGGFAGGITGGGVDNCYSSGDVTAKSTAGGFVGFVYTVQSISSCYSTSNVHADSTAGGFAGRIDAGWIDHCVAYGNVLKLDGTQGGAASYSHGFLGRLNVGGITTSYYLRGQGYNDATTDPVATARGYNAIKKVTVVSNKTLAAGDSHPYSVGLRGKAFPFHPVAYANRTVLSHYGNWYSAS